MDSTFQQQQQQLQQQPQPQLQQQQQHLNSTSQNTNNLRKPTQNVQPRNIPPQQQQQHQQQPQQLGCKDLIIRMLAEVFQVNQCNDGQVKWQQFSTSLVPVSLYSRTTSKWLNYLLTASNSINYQQQTDPTTTSAMSPDSRDFLILLQQFHQQQQINQGAQLFGDEHNFNVVFQVVAHDFINGQCKKILNVKLSQPGTRLGQASDYFVYWKEQSQPPLPPPHLTLSHNHPHPHHNLQHQISSTPFGANNPTLIAGSQQQQYLMFNNDQQMAAGVSPTNCMQYNNWRPSRGQDSAHTWGLNFASINDAKLFYDICSLNLVDLDFNSDYLKKIASSDRNRLIFNPRNHKPIQYLPQASRDCNNNSNNNILINENEQIVIRDFLNHKQRRLQQKQIQQQTNIHQFQTQQKQHLCHFDNQDQNVKNSIKKQSSTSKCPACYHLIQLNENSDDINYNNRVANNNSRFIHTETSRTTICPVHPHLQRVDQQLIGRQNSSSTQRIRSRSTTRHPLESTTNELDDTKQSLKRSRSFSAPASPEAKEPKDTFSPHYNYQESSTDCERLENCHHHARCSRQKYRELLLKQSTESEKPQKPIRGVLRDTAGTAATIISRGDRMVQNTLHQDSITSSRLLHSKRIPKARYMGHLVGNQVPNFEKYYPDQTGDTNYKQFEDQPEIGQNVEIHNNSGYSQQYDSSEFQHDQRAHQRFSSGQSAQRRSTGVDSTNVDELSSSLSHRNARLARAQYANSKNMKEFLSLDAGGLQSTPTQITALNEKFQQQIRATGSGKVKNNKQHETLKKSSATQKLKEHDHSIYQQEQKKSASSKMNQSTSKDSDKMGNKLDQYGNIGGKISSNNDGTLEENDAMRNASTTTDDLPLDPLMRKRMFKLTSEEVISEKTEPRSLSIISIEQQRQQQRGETLDRQTRAVSLGPAHGKELRGRNARSDTGRRRSLERSTCVDLDSNFPASSFKKHYCLPPLPQSASPIVMESSKSSPSFVGLNANSDVENLHEKHTRFATAIATPKRQRTKSFCRSDFCSNTDYTTSKLSEFNHQEKNIDTYQHPFGMISFKSAPDVCELYRGQVNIIDDFNQFNNNTRNTPSNNRKLNCNNMIYGHHQQNLLATTNTITSTTVGTATQTMPKSIASLSSYAVPICFESREQKNYGRQIHSCPSSLRRKRKDLHYHDRLQNSDYKAGYLPPANELTQVTHRKMCHCQFCLGAREKYYGKGKDLEKDFLCDTGVYRENRNIETNDCMFYSSAGNRSALSDTEYTSCAYCGRVAANYGGVCGNKSFDLQEHHCQHIKPAPHKCVTNMAANGHEGFEEKFISARPDCHHFTPTSTTTGARKLVTNGLHYRPCSSASSRSPLRCGLYESEDEDEGEEKEDEQQIENETCHARMRSGCCVSNNEDFNRSSSLYFRPSALKPVQGYDQTMARASLKSRQRAKSQPPSDLQLEDAVYLTKSMENVQKLIKEVQNELDSLNRRPLSGFHCLGTALMPTTRSDLESRTKAQIRESSSLHHGSSSAGKHSIKSNKGSRSDRSIVQDESYIKMSIEEANNLATRDEVENCISSVRGDLKSKTGTTITTAKTLDKMSTSSATKRAGQFKCVGAIRKAGFLSVKKWILKRRQTIELARKQGWKRYWVCLRGTALLFHSVIDKKSNNKMIIDEENTTATHEDKDECDTTDLLTWIQTNCAGQTHMLSANFCYTQQKDENNINNPLQSREEFLRNMSQCYIEKEPRHLIIIEGAIAQPIPEHPKRDHVFCLSTAFGDAYLFQSSCQVESENWISAIHNACAASIARDLTRDEAIKLFETKIRHLEVEAEKKIFLRQRLESRLTSMSSMSHITTASLMNMPRNPTDHQFDTLTSGEVSKTIINDVQAQKKITMRSLLYRLNQQLLALETYIEQLHCEVYQLRCYLSSCGAQHVFYQTIQNLNHISPAFLSIDLPHPRSLLMHVSKPTKLLLIRLGVFTVSSFHAYIHARQGIADKILQKIQQSSQASNEVSPIKLRIGSHSISENILDRGENNELESDTEKLIHLSNLKAVNIKVLKKLVYNIRQDIEKNELDQDNTNQLLSLLSPESDDLYSIKEEEDYIVINLKLHSNSSSISIIKQLLSIINPNSCELDHLNYYLQFQVTKSNGDDDDARDDKGNSSAIYVVKRRETLSDWFKFEHLELVEKIIFRVELTRKRLGEETSPFGISIGAQLFTTKIDNVLNVYCSYIEWGSVADKAGLKDEDELLMINGVPVMDLDMMFIECMVQDEMTKLRLVVRSSRSECPPNTILLEKSTWKPFNDGKDDDNGDGEHKDNFKHASFSRKTEGSQNARITSDGSQIISDEYILSLVCPPPPSQSSAFLRTNPELLRQSSHLTSEHSTKNRLAIKNDDSNRIAKEAPLGLIVSRTIPSLTTNERQQHHQGRLSPNTKSEQILNDAEYQQIKNDLGGERSAILDREGEGYESVPVEPEALGKFNSSSSIDLASQLLKKTAQLTQLLGKNPVESWTNDGSDKDGVVNDSRKAQSTYKGEQVDIKSTDMNSVERLRKAILELLETEYAYIRHLETICDHYMGPLQGISFLNILELKHLNQIVLDLLALQRSFFSNLTDGIWSKFSIMNKSVKSGDGFEKLNQIAQQLDVFKSTDDFQPLLSSLAQVFLDEADKFKIYASYCASYSRLQKLMHPRRIQGSNLSTSLIASVPNTLDTFLVSNSFGTSTTISSNSNSLQHREFLKPLGSFITMSSSNTNDLNNSQLKQLGEFLGHLDSSSSSASLSLPKSSSGTPEPSHQANNDQSQKKTATTTSGKNLSRLGSFQKSAHQQNFESYLIKPIQRIVKYPMLLNSIAVSASIFVTDDLNQSLYKAVKQMEAITSHVNDTQRIHDEYGIIFDHIERQFLEQRASLAKIQRNPSAIPPNLHQPLIDLGIEQLLHFGTVEWLNINEFTSKVKKDMNLTQVLFVFNSCVVFICKEQMRSTKSKKFSNSNSGTNFTLVSNINSNNSSSKCFPKRNSDFNEAIRYQTVIPVSEVQVRSASNNSKNGARGYQWELFRCSAVNSNSSLLTKASSKRNTSGKVYLLSSPTTESRNACLRKIRFIIRESVRNMNLPLARSPSSKSLTPKKLSSPSSGGGTNTNSSCSTSFSPVCNSGEHHHHSKDGENNCGQFNDQVDSNYTASIEVNN